MGQSKKHHYIPRFYLNGFVDEAGKFFIYDKITDKIWQSTPANSFAENRRNTGTIEHQVTKEVFFSDLPEEMITHFDTRAATVFNIIRNSQPEDSVLNEERIYILRMFILSLFWRTPINDSLRKKIIQDQSFEELGFGIFDSKTGKRNIEAENVLKQVDLFVKVYPTLLPITSFLKPFVKYNAPEWKLYYKSDKYSIVTDYPIIHNSFKDFSSLHEDVIFPVSNRILLVSTKKYKPHILAPVFNLNVDLLLCHNAGRYIACANKNYLEFLISQSKEQLTKPSWADKIKETMFNSFY